MKKEIIKKMEEIFLSKEFNLNSFDKIIKDRLDGRIYQRDKWWISNNIIFNYKHHKVTLLVKLLKNSIYDGFIVDGVKVEEK